MGNAVGFVVYYEEDPEEPASGFDAGAYISRWSTNMWVTISSMLADRPGKTLCIQEVAEIPEWVKR